MNPTVTSGNKITEKLLLSLNHGHRTSVYMDREKNYKVHGIELEGSLNTSSIMTQIGVK